MPEMKTLNGYEVVDAKAREDIEAIKAGEIDLSNYATKAELPTKVSQLQNDSKFITRDEVPNPDLSEYITESELNAKGYLTQHQDISHLAPKSSIPTKVSQLTNDSNYLTAIPEEYITEADLNAKGYLTSIPNEFVTESELNSKGYITQHQSLQGYATEAYVVAEIAKAKLESEDVDLSGLATKDDLKNFITEIPSEYVTESELSAKGYITDVSNLALKSSIPTKVSQLTNDKGYLTAIPSEYVTETDLNNKGYLTQHQSLADYAKKSEIPDVSKYQTAEQVQALIDEALGVIENGSY